MTITVTEVTAEWAVKVPNGDSFTYEIHSDEFWARIYAGADLTVVHRELGGDWQVAS